MEGDGMTWYRIGRDEIGWGGMGWDGIIWNPCGMEGGGMGRDEDGMMWDGMAVGR